ncbi:protein sombrero [Phtheirospermum japonicum]|uniref:Protein sombrero n=1 Tax=Phtheirospermum japonicum TaxID=374723 RepID=A0A830DMP7_9LAMI|nr:protein sombrero [Phtheirospermum japonicum]
MRNYFIITSKRRSLMSPLTSMLSHKLISTNSSLGTSKKNVESGRGSKTSGTFSATKTKSIRRAPGRTVRQLRVSGRRRGGTRPSTRATRRESGCGKHLFSTWAGPLMDTKLIGSCTNIAWTITNVLLMKLKKMVG